MSTHRGGKDFRLKFSLDFCFPVFVKTSKDKSKVKKTTVDGQGKL